MRSKIVLSVAAIGIVLGGLWALQLLYRTFSLAPVSDFDSIQRYVREHSEELERVAGQFRKDSEATITIDGKEFGPYSTDANGSVYFIVDWNTFANVGFVHRLGEAKLLGDGVEPNVAETKHMFGNWWYYVGN